MMPEAIAIVCAPSFNAVGYFSITPALGMRVLRACQLQLRQCACVRRQRRVCTAQNATRQSLHVRIALPPKQVVADGEHHRRMESDEAAGVELCAGEEGGEGRQ